jgi:hypothetical protein
LPKDPDAFAFGGLAEFGTLLCTILQSAEDAASRLLIKGALLQPMHKKPHPCSSCNGRRDQDQMIAFNSSSFAGFLEVDPFR